MDSAPLPLRKVRTFCPDGKLVITTVFGTTGLGRSHTVASAARYRDVQMPSLDLQEKSHRKVALHYGARLTTTNSLALRSGNYRPCGPAAGARARRSTISTGDDSFTDLGLHDEKISTGNDSCRNHGFHDKHIMVEGFIWGVATKAACIIARVVLQQERAQRSTISTVDDSFTDHGFHDKHIMVEGFIWGGCNQAGARARRSTISTGDDSFTDLGLHDEKISTGNDSCTNHGFHDKHIMVEGFIWGVATKVACIGHGWHSNTEYNNGRRVIKISRLKISHTVLRSDNGCARALPDWKNIAGTDLFTHEGAPLHIL
ncbi:hypothetical protein MSG28_010495 [Choristoneura fumiferana]|uniref:Uncharacterized protein n=1 Tax=Choristoneura fumiferana TaxID=7141 RepID=A0ACC0KMB1_CHOFU|nr:hypothetical protein MSG28_010495 [Choristoneura fumiferana]